MSESSGVAHNLTAVDIEYLLQLKDQGQVSEAWAYLAQKGDAYAVLAADVVKAEPDTQVGKSNKGDRFIFGPLSYAEVSTEGGSKHAQDGSYRVAQLPTSCGSARS